MTVDISIVVLTAIVVVEPEVVVVVVVADVDVDSDESTETFPSHVCQKLMCCITICWVYCIYLAKLSSIEEVKLCLTGSVYYLELREPPTLHQQWLMAFSRLVCSVLIAKQCERLMVRNGDNEQVYVPSDLALPHSDISLKGISYKLIYHVIYVLVDADTKSTNEHFPPSLHNTIPQFFRIRHSWFILLQLIAYLLAVNK